MSLCVLVFFVHDPNSGGILFVKVFLNGEKRELPAPATIQTAVDHLGLSGRHLVAELNMEILPREIWGEKLLSDGDNLEIIGFVGGGALSMSSSTA